MTVRRPELQFGRTSVRAQCQLVQWHVPVRVKDLEAPLLFLPELTLVGIELLCDLLFARWSHERLGAAEADLHRERPVGPAVAVITGHVYLDAADAPALLAFQQHGPVVPAKEIFELRLEPPLHAVEVPRHLLGRRGWPRRLR